MSPKPSRSLQGALLYALSIATIVLGVYWEPVAQLTDRSLKFFR